jgi:hypothetical protein
MAYSKESIQKIKANFQDLLVDADNFPRDAKDTSYKQFWLGLRKEGPEILGLVRHLMGVLKIEEKPTNKS